MGEIRVAWVSRHPPLPSQIGRLKEMLGAFSLIQIRDTFKDADAVLERVKEAGANISVVVLPMSMLAQYLPLAQREGIDVWFARMQGLGEVEGMPKEFNPNTDVLLPMRGSSKSRWLRFEDFEKVKEVRVITEQITGRDLMRYRGRGVEIGF